MALLRSQLMTAQEFFNLIQKLYNVIKSSYNLSKKSPSYEADRKRLDLKYISLLERIASIKRPISGLTEIVSENIGWNILHFVVALKEPKLQQQVLNYIYPVECGQLMQKKTTVECCIKNIPDWKKLKPIELAFWKCGLVKGQNNFIILITKNAGLFPLFFYFEQKFKQIDTKKNLKELTEQFEDFCRIVAQLKRSTNSVEFLEFYKSLAIFKSAIASEYMLLRRALLSLNMEQLQKSIQDFVKYKFTAHSINMTTNYRSDEFALSFFNFPLGDSTGRKKKIKEIYESYSEGNRFITGCDL